MVYRFGASLYYANTSRFTEELATLVEDADPPVRWIAIDAEAISDIDLQAADAVRVLREELTGRNVTVVLCRISPAVQQLLDAYDLVSGPNAIQVFADVTAVVDAYHAASSPPA